MRESMELVADGVDVSLDGRRRGPGPWHLPGALATAARLQGTQAPHWPPARCQTPLCRQIRTNFIMSFSRAKVDDHGFNSIHLSQPLSTVMDLVQTRPELSPVCPRPVSITSWPARGLVPRQLAMLESNYFRHPCLRAVPYLRQIDAAQKLVCVKVLADRCHLHVLCRGLCQSRCYCTSICSRQTSRTCRSSNRLNTVHPPNHFSRQTLLTHAF
jgi:hypothetical protein